MESFTQVFPLDWTTVTSVALVVGILAVLAVCVAVILRQARNRRDAQILSAADKIATLCAGKIMTRVHEDEDRFALKESDSIKSLIAEAVLALSAEDPRLAGRAIERLKAGTAAPAVAIFADIARAKRAEAEQASREAATSLRHQGALTLPDDPRAALDLFREALKLDAAAAANRLALALVHFRLDDLRSVEALGATVGEDSSEEGAGLIHMLAGILYMRQGHPHQAVEKFVAAKQSFAARGDPKAQVDALMALANAQLKGGDRDAALASYNQAAALSTENNYELGLAQFYADLGSLLQSLGKSTEAEKMLIRSFTIATLLKETAIASTAAGSLALHYRETNDLARAEDMMRESLRLEGLLERKAGMARASLNLGTILFEKGRFDEAGSRFTESVRLYEELGPPERVAEAIFNLANVHRTLKRTDEAEKSYRRALVLFLGVNDAGGVAKASGNLGALYLEGGRLADAEEEFNIALDAAREAADTRSIAMQMRNLAVLAHARGETAAACDGLRKSLALCDEIEARTEALELKVLMGQIGCEQARA
jgi:tetratricopeptide (TPR) repeat protein